MREINLAHIGKGGVRPAMVGMTRTAGEIRGSQQQDAVQAGGILALKSDIDVTGGAAVGHLVCAPERGVAKFALPIAPGM